MSLFSMIKMHQLTVARVENPSGDCYAIYFNKPDDLDWQAGAYAYFLLPQIKEKSQHARYLNLASLPEEKEFVVLVHSNQSSSRFKQTLTSLASGETIQMKWLVSPITLKNEQALICFASDLGIAALRPVIKKWAGKREIYLSHLDQKGDVDLFDEELSQTSQAVTNLTYERFEQLRDCQENFTKVISQYKNEATYILAGIPSEIKEIKRLLQEQKISLKNIKIESFKGLK
ncbi:MAG: ferredoxin reductase [Streptococcus sp.]|nr:ferredoxin reductase [Streptococcus sp.]